jgi:hypothetical protein
MKAPRNKLQTTKNLQVPMTNEQIPRKPQFPNSNGVSGGAVGWDLKLGIYLEPGHWALEIRKEDVDLRLTTAN